MPDPGETRLLLQEQADVTAESMSALLQYWQKLDPLRCGLTTAAVIQMCKEPPMESAQLCAELRDVLEGFLGKLEARALGFKLRTYRRRVFHGLFIDRLGADSRGIRWAVYTSAEFSKTG
jgi:hypothetical protein